MRDSRRMSANSEKPKPKALWRAAELAADEQSFSHPWNPKSEVRGARLGVMAGLVRTGVSLVKLAPGKESFVYHTHHFEEEWLYVLSGRGVMEIDGVEHELAPGDFVGFATPSVAHHLRNPFEVELVYLTGGESREFEVADFPKLNVRVIRRGQEHEVYPLDAAKKWPDR